MKKKTLTLLALTALFLTGCNTGKTSESETNPKSDTASEKEAIPEDTAKATEAPATDVSEAPKETATATQGGSATFENTGETAGSAEESSVSPSVDLTAAWPQKVKTFLMENLGGQLIPYVNLGKSTSLEYEIVEPSYDNDYEVYHLEISGTVEYSTTLANTFQQDYTASGYTVTGTSTKKVAKNAAANLTVSLVNDTDLGAAVLHVAYDEPYDASKRTTYPSEVQSEFSTIFGSHASDIPLVYLGTTTPTYEETTSGNSTGVIVKGRKWNDLILTDTKTTLTNAGFDTSTSTTSVIIGTKTFSDQYEMTITIEKGSSYNTGNYPKRTITRKEPFDASGFTAWPQDILDRVDDFYDGHTLPVIYLGTTSPIVSYQSQSLGEFDVKGGAWDARIRSLALTSLSTTYGYTEDTAAEASSYHTDVLIRTKTETDGCKLRIELYNSNGSALVEFHCVAGFGDPSSQTDWSQDVKDAFDTYCNGIYPPFIYLGKSVSVSYLCSQNRVELNGQTWDDVARSNALTVLTAKGWTEDTAAETSSYYDNILIRNSPVDETNYVKWQIKLYKYNGKVDCEFIRSAAYNKNNTDTSYPQDVLDDISDNLNGETLPYVYLGTNAPTTSWSSYSSQLTITGEAWDNEIITKAKTAYSAAGWTEETGATTEAVTFTKKDDKGYFSATFGKNYSDKPKIEVSYIPWTTETDYTDAVKTELSTYRNNVTTLPFVFLGDDTALTTTKKDGAIVISGNIKKNTALEKLFIKAYTDAGWTADSTISSGKCRTLEKDGYTFTATFNNNTYTSSGGYVADITVKSISPYNFSDLASRSYSDDEKTLIKSALGNNRIPLLYLGTKTPTIAQGTYSSSYSAGIKITGSKWNDDRLKDNKPLLEAAGFTVSEIAEGDSFGHFTGYSKAVALQGYKALGTTPADGYIRFILTRDDAAINKSNAIAVFFYDAPETIDDGTATTTKWNEDATNVALRQSKLGGTTLPFRDLGTVTRKATTAGDGIKRTCKFTNITNVQPYARNAIEKLKAFDPTLKNTNLDLSYDNQGRKGVWIGTAADGNRLTYKVTALSTRTIEVTYSECFNPNPETDWQAEVKAARQEQLGGHVIPYFSIGTKNYKLTKGTNTVTLTGKTWDDSIFSIVEASLASDTSLKWTSVDNGKDLLLAKAEASDGTLYIQLTKNSTNNPVCKFSYTPKQSA